MKRITWKKNIFVTALIAVLVIVLAGCSSTGTQPEASVETEKSVAGTILLAVNPEIEIDYDDDGLVLEIEGINAEGKQIVSGYQNYAGKPT